MDLICVSIKPWASRYTPTHHLCHFLVNSSFYPLSAEFFVLLLLNPKGSLHILDLVTSWIHYCCINEWFGNIFSILCVAFQLLSFYYLLSRSLYYLFTFMLVWMCALQFRYPRKPEEGTSSQAAVNPQHGCSELNKWAVGRAGCSINIESSLQHPYFNLTTYWLMGNIYVFSW